MSTSAEQPAPDYVPAEVQIGNTRPAMSQSQIDSLDRFVSTVRVRTAFPSPGQGTQIRECSGVFIHPQLVIETSTGWEMNTEYSNADLALVVLEKPPEEPIKPVSLATEPVQLEERLIMVGFGAETLDRDQGDGERRYGENAVVSIKEDRSTFHVGRQLKIAPSYNGEKPGVLRIRGSYVAKGDSGGPCFRERKGALELVGIARSTQGPPIVLSVYTSTHAYLGWLHQKIAHAGSSLSD